MSYSISHFSHNSHPFWLTVATVQHISGLVLYNKTTEQGDYAESVQFEHLFERAWEFIYMITLMLHVHAWMCACFSSTYRAYWGCSPCLRSCQTGCPWSWSVSTGTGGIGAEGAPSGTDPQPPCNLHSCLDSVQLQTQKLSFNSSITCKQVHEKNLVKRAPNKTGAIHILNARKKCTLILV